MGVSKRHRTPQPPTRPGLWARLEPERRCEIGGILVLALALFLFLALITDQYGRGVARPLDAIAETQNLFGVPGAVIAGALAVVLGEGAHAVYLLLAVWGVGLLRRRPVDRWLTRGLGVVVLLISLCGLIHINVAGWSGTAQPGGALGAFAADSLFVPAFGSIGANVTALTFLIIGILLSTEFLLVHGVLALHAGGAHVLRTVILGTESLRRLQAERQAHTREQRASKLRARAKAKPQPVFDDADREPLAPVIEEAPAPEPEPALPNWDEAEQEELPFLPGGETAADEAAEAAAALAEAGSDDAYDAAIEAASEEAPRPKPLEPLPTRAQLELEPEASAPARTPEHRKVRRRVESIPDALPENFEYPQVYTPPPYEMLDVPRHRVIKNLDEKLQQISEHLENTLRTFNIEARVVDVVRGPTITRFELEPATGVKVSAFSQRADDIALALKAHSVRVEAPIPGKGRVGIEVPNSQRDQVLIRDIIESSLFQQHKGPLPLGLGKDIAGDVQVADLSRMPHMLVAGATGAGKTVCVKALLASLLFNKPPSELQLMLIDPKMVELSIFNDIPHLITPVVTDPKKAATSLNWLINEMEERYRLFAHLRVRNIEVYNESVDNGEIEVEGESEEGAEATEGRNVELVRKLPYIVCVIDELADLMMLARSEVEGAIARLAQLARAVGIHLIIATQRPSVDVLTGVIKANFPARVSFQVSSRVDSRCILDEIGAERLIGNGDMLYLPAGRAKPTRVQGAFVSDEEMNALIAYLKTQAPPQYRAEIEKFGKEESLDETLLEESDPLFDEAVRVVLETGQASISMVQRRLRVGYTRAARLIDMMELKGIVGPHTGSKAREILVDAPPSEEVA